MASVGIPAKRRNHEAYAYLLGDAVSRCYEVIEEYK